MSSQTSLDDACGILDELVRKCDRSQGRCDWCDWCEHFGGVFKKGASCESFFLRDEILACLIWGFLSEAI